MKFLFTLVAGIIGLCHIFRKETNEKWIWVGPGKDPFN